MQPELFPNLPVSSEPKNGYPALFPRRYLRIRVAYENLIFSSLALLLALLAGFCVGVERGKRLVSPPGLEHRVASEKAVLPLGRVVPAIASIQPPVAAGPVKREGGSYAIQLASYLDAKVAQAEADRLKRRGLNAQVIRQGRYYELRIVGFRVRTEALTVLASLKKTYQDSFVKRLSSG